MKGKMILTSVLLFTSLFAIAQTEVSLASPNLLPNRETGQALHSVGKTNTSSQSPLTTRRELMQDFLNGKTFDNYVPTAFFMHFPAKTGLDAVYYHVRHLNRTGVDLLKIQFEQSQPKINMLTAEDWQKIQPLPRDFYAPTLEVVREVFDIVGQETMVLPTVYSAFQTLRMQIGIPSVIRWAKERPDEVLRALRIYNDALLQFVRDCKALGIDGFFMPTQGGARTSTTRCQDSSRPLSVRST